MVVHYFHVPSVPISPHKADSPLVVDANAMLVAPIPKEGFQPVAGRYSQIVDTCIAIDETEFYPSSALYGFREFPNAPPLRYCLGIPVSETPDHSNIIALCSINQTRLPESHASPYHQGNHICQSLS